MTRRLPPLTVLRAFEAVARHRSMARAADELSVTAAAISHQIRHLEEYYGLFMNETAVGLNRTLKSSEQPNDRVTVNRKVRRGFVLQLRGSFRRQTVPA